MHLRKEASEHNKREEKMSTAEESSIRLSVMSPGTQMQLQKHEQQIELIALVDTYFCQRGKENVTGV